MEGAGREGAREEGVLGSCQAWAQVTLRGGRARSQGTWAEEQAVDTVQPEAAGPDSSPQIKTVVKPLGWVASPREGGPTEEQVETPGASAGLS